MQLDFYNRVIFAFSPVFITWWTLRDSNPRPLPCEGSVLPIKLNDHLVLPDGFEPPTSQLSVATGYKPAVLPLN